MIFQRFYPLSKFHFSACITLIINNSTKIGLIENLKDEDNTSHAETGMNKPHKDYIHFHFITSC